MLQTSFSFNLFWSHGTNEHKQTLELETIRNQTKLGFMTFLGLKTHLKVTPKLIYKFHLK